VLLLRMLAPERPVVKWNGQRIGDSVLVKIEDGDVEVEALIDAEEAVEVGTMFLRLGTGAAGNVLDQEIDP